MQVVHDREIPRTRCSRYSRTIGRSSGSSIRHVANNVHVGRRSSDSCVVCMKLEHTLPIPSSVEQRNGTEDAPAWFGRAMGVARHDNTTTATSPGTRSTQLTPAPARGKGTREHYVFAQRKLLYDQLTKESPVLLPELSKQRGLFQAESGFPDDVFVLFARHATDWQARRFWRKMFEETAADVEASLPKLAIEERSTGSRNQETLI